MGDFYKEMYNFDKVKEYVDSEISEITNVETITITHDSDGFKSSKTFSEIETLLHSGKPIITFYFDDNDNYSFQLSQVTQRGTTGTEIHISGSVYAGIDGTEIAEFVIKNDNSITYDTYISSL